jgi:hypothetical protein
LPEIVTKVLFFDTKVVEFVIWAAELAAIGEFDLIDGERELW